MKRILDWVGAILVAMVGIGLALTVLFLIEPKFHFNEPGFAEGLIPYRGAVNDDEVERNLKAALEQKFPPGTSELELKLMLYLYGFRAAPPTSAYCVRQIQTEPSGVGPQRCFEASDNVLKYTWGGLVCGHWILVNWKTNSRAEVTQVIGRYGSACL